jgi:uncharacterized metal-binding protein
MMSDCCHSGPAKAGDGSCCAGPSKRTVLLYACSGGANVAEISDKVARELMFEGAGTMFCLAGIGAGIGGMVQTARDADLNLVIDGCPMDCAKKVFEKAQLTNYRYIRVTDLGIEKVKGVRCGQEQVRKVLEAARAALTAE